MAVSWSRVLNSVEPLSEYLANTLQLRDILSFLRYRHNVRGENHVIELHQWRLKWIALVLAHWESIDRCTRGDQNLKLQRAGISATVPRATLMKMTGFHALRFFFAHHVHGFIGFRTCREMTSHLFRRSVMVYWTDCVAIKTACFDMIK